jgi:exopolysaccharide biosynthesis protein
MNRMTVNEMKADLKAKIALIKQTRQDLKTLRSDIKRERDIQKIVKQDSRAARKAAQIAKLEAKLLAMKSPKSLRKASQKASPVVSYTAEQIAEMNAAVA